MQQERVLMSVIMQIASFVLCFFTVHKNTLTKCLNVSSNLPLDLGVIVRKSSGGPIIPLLIKMHPSNLKS